MSTLLVDSPELWMCAPLAALVRHLEADHTRWRLELIPEIELALERALVGDYSEEADKLRSLISQVVSTLDLHTRLEERVLFPAIVEVDRCRAEAVALPALAFGSLRNPILMMDRDHADEQDQWEAAEALARAAGGRCHALLDCLKLLRQEVILHSRLETTVLFPRAMALES